MSEAQTTKPCNLEIACAELGRALVKSAKKADEKVLNELLAVLEEQGPYAMALYLRTRHKEVNTSIAPLMAKKLADILRKNQPEQNDDVLMNLLRDIAEDLDDLLLAHEILRTALAYARYYRKAISQQGE